MSDNQKILRLTFPDSKYKSKLADYEKMGFTLFSSTHYTERNEAGAVVAGYYKVIFTYDMSRKNADKAYEMYKTYVNKCSELSKYEDYLEEDFPFRGDIFLRLAAIFSVLAIPLVIYFFGESVMIYGWVNIIFVPFMSLALGASCGVITNVFYTLIMRKKWFAEAMEKVPKLEEEVAQLPNRVAQILRS